MSIFKEECYSHIAGQIKIVKDDIPDNNNALEVLRLLEDRFVALFRNDNPHFDKGKFLAACALPSDFTDTSEIFMIQGK